MKVNYFTDLENSDMMNSVINMARTTEKPINVTQFWIDYKNKNATEREAKGLFKRFRDKLSVEMQKSMRIDTDLKVRILFVMNCPISMELLEEIQATPTSRITFDQFNQILTYENEITEVKLTAYNENGELQKFRRHGRRLKRSSEESEDVKRKYKKKSIDEMMAIAEDVDNWQRPPEFHEEIYDFEEVDFEDVSHVNHEGLRMILKKEVPSTSKYSEEATTSSDSTASIEIVDFLHHFKYLVLSMAAVELGGLKMEINEAIRNLQFQRIRIKQLQIVLKSTLNFIATSSECSTSSDPSKMLLQDFLKLFQLMVANLDIPELSELAVKVREVLDEHGEKKIAISKLRLALQNVMEMIAC